MQLSRRCHCHNSETAAAPVAVVPWVMVCEPVAVTLRESCCSGGLPAGPPPFSRERRILGAWAVNGGLGGSVGTSTLSRAAGEHGPTVAAVRRRGGPWGCGAPAPLQTNHTRETAAPGLALEQATDRGAARAHRGYGTRGALHTFAYG